MKENSKDIEHILTGSLVVGFICYKIASLIPLSIGETIDCIGITLFAIIVSYILGRLLNSRFIIKIYNFLKIRETGKMYLWDDIIDNDFPMKANVYYDDIKYNGYLFSYESYSNLPKVILVSYIISSTNNIIEDNSKDKTKIIILDTEKADKVEIIYNEESKICNEIELFCNDRKINNP